jgi:NAD-dependent DNA ligase
VSDKFYILKKDGHPGEHEQIRPQQWNQKRLIERSLDELLGLCKGLVADRILNEEETSVLIAWLEANRQVEDSWPANVLMARINSMLADRRIDADERTELFSLLNEIAAGGRQDKIVPSLSTSLPLTKPVPTIVFPSRVFCFTGKFYFGTRQACQMAVRERGGLIQDNVTQQTHYLVVGTLGSTDWAHSTHGRKIEHAVELAQKGLPIALVSEQHWTSQL